MEKSVLLSRLLLPAITRYPLPAICFLRCLYFCLCVFFYFLCLALPLCGMFCRVSGKDMRYCTLYRRMERKKKKKDALLRQTVDWYESTSPRLRSICVGVACLLVALFFVLVLFEVAGSGGAWVYRHLFMTGDKSSALLGWGFVILTALLVALGVYLCFARERISYFRLIFGGIVILVSLGVLFSALADEVAGGAIGSSLFDSMREFLGVFSYILTPLMLLGALYILKIFCPVSIWGWFHGVDLSVLPFVRGRADMDDEGYDDEDEDGEEYEDEGEEDGEDDDEEYDDEEEDDEEKDEGHDEEEDGEEFAPESAAEDAVPYIPPPFSLLNPEKGRGKANNTKAQAQAIQRTFQTFKIDVEVEEVTVGPTFTRYAVRPAEGIRLSRITSLQQNLELALAAHPIRIEAPIPGHSLVGIEVPNSSRATLGLQTLLESKEFSHVSGSLGLVVGKTINGSLFAKGLGNMPHVLVAGTTGSGKSVLIHNFILSLLFNYGPRDLRFIFIDPKRVELTLYKGVPHLYTEPITEPKKALQALVWVASEMERRYELLEARRARNIDSYNQMLSSDDEDSSESDEHMPYLVVVIDELADLMQTFPREIEGNIVRIAQKSRAVGIHLIISTQRPSVNIITGVVKANIPVRIALQVASSIDSRTILDAAGAENLIGAGDLLYSSSENKKPVRAQSAFVTEEEVKRVANYLLKHNGVAEGVIDITKRHAGDSGGGGVFGDSDEEEDELYPEALSIVAESGRASTSLLQRKLKVGYSRAARLIDMLEENGIVGPADGSKPREVLVDRGDPYANEGGAGSGSQDDSDL